MQYKKIIEISDFENNKRIPLSSLERQRLQKKYPYYGAQGVIDKVESYIFDGNYLLVAEDGENLSSRKDNISRLANGKFWVNNHAHILKFENDVDRLYVNYYLNNLDLSAYITGSAQPKLSKANLSKVKISWPEEKKREKIVYLLNNFDRKIEVNNKIIDNLEQQAQAIFKSWFIDFEPFQDGEFIDSELGLIPKGWKVIKFGDLLKFVKGKKPKKSLDILNPVPYFVKGVVDGVESPQMVDSKGVILIDELDTIMLMDGANSGNVYYGFKGALGSTFSLLETSPVYKEVFYWYLFTNESQIKNQNTGSAIPHANKDYINQLTIAIPKDIESSYINTLLTTYRKQIISLRKQNQKLAETRDLLIPKLMSGEIDVSDLDL